LETIKNLWLGAVALAATQEVEVRRIIVKAQPGQNKITETPK
jgi:hypothetical protein